MTQAWIKIDSAILTKDSFMLKISLIEQSEVSGSISRVIEEVYPESLLTRFPSFEEFHDQKDIEGIDVLVYDVAARSSESLLPENTFRPSRALENAKIVVLLPEGSTMGMMDTLIRKGADYILKHPINKEELYTTFRIIDRDKNFHREALVDYEYKYRDLQKDIDILRAKGSNFQNIFDQAPIGILIYDESGRMIDHNSEVLEILGIQENAIEQFCEIIQFPSTPKEIKFTVSKNRIARYMKVIDFDEIRKENKYVITKEGKMHLSIQITQVITDLNKFLYLVFLLDRTKRKFYEEQNRMLEQAVKQSPDSIVVVDRQGKIEYVNPEFTNLTGYTESESIGRNPRMLRSGKTPREKYKTLWETILKGEIWKGEFINRKKDGTQYIEKAVISPILNAEGEITHFMGIKKDITDQKKKEQELSILSQAIDQSSRSVAVVGKDMKIAYANSQFLKLNNCQREKIIGQDIRNVSAMMRFLEDPTAISESLSKFQQWIGEFQVGRPGGKPVWTRIVLSPIYNDQHQISHILSVREDITDRKGIERRLGIEKERAKKLAEAKTEFLSNMSHEIRTPLNGIIGLINILINENPRQDQKEYLKLLSFTSDHLLSLINNVLDLNKIDDGKLKLELQDRNLEFTLARILGTYQPKASSRDLRLSLDYSKDIQKYFYFDKTRFTQIISNLLNNAVKFTKKGFIKIGVASVIDEGSYSTLRLTIADSGIGIPKGKIDHIFDRFSQVEVSGNNKLGSSGLGLAITRRLLKLMGSDIFVTSKEGEGTTFSFDLKLRKGQGNDEIANSQDVTANSLGEEFSVLSVDDNMVNQLIIEKYIVSWGGKVDKAGDGYEALDKISNKKYDLVLMDVQMPHLNGFEAARAIRSKDSGYYKRVPIIAISASTEQRQKQQAQRAGMDYYLTKPYHPDELKNLLIKFSKIELHKNTNQASELTKSEKTFFKYNTNIDQQLENYSSGDKEFKVRLIDALLDSLAEFKSSMEDAISRKDVNLLREVHHKMKTSLLMLKQDELDQTLGKIRADVASRKNSSAERRLLTLRRKVDHLSSQLRAVRRETVEFVSE